MTREEIENMPAGEELSQLVNNRIMGSSKLHPQYSTDISASWEVVERMQQNGYCFDADGNAQRKRIRFGVGQEIAEAETMPLAICRAALLATMELVK